MPILSIWDISVRKQYRHGATAFALQASFRADALRVVLHGPSGAGKTQTLRMIAGITRPDVGHVRIAGRVLADSTSGLWVAPRRRNLGYVFQDHALFPHLTVAQNIAFGLARGWRAPRRSEPAVERWIERFRLQPVAAHYPHQISGGQRQRVALARALVTEPSALLLDEPFAALDRALRQRLREELLELQAKLELPLLLITHDDEDVRFLAQCVVCLEAGRVASVSGLGLDGLPAAACRPSA